MKSTMVRTVVFAVLNWLYLHFKKPEMTAKDEAAKADIRRIDHESDSDVLRELRERYTRPEG